MSRPAAKGANWFFEQESPEGGFYETEYEFVADDYNKRIYKSMEDQNKLYGGLIDQKIEEMSGMKSVDGW